MASLVAALGLIICISKFGVGLSNDSVAYLVAAKSFYAEGRFFLPYRDSYFTDWPPLFSILLSSTYFLNIDNKIFFYGAHIVLVYSLVVFLFFRLAVKLTSSLSWSLVTTFFFITAPPTFITFSYLWSETYFILFTILFIISLSNYISSHKLIFLFACSVCAGLSVMMRYGGVVNIFTGVLLLLFYSTENTFSKIFTRLVYFGVLSSAPLIWWFIRNYSISSTLTGAGRTVEISHFKYTVVTLAKAIWLWFLPYPAISTGGILSIVSLSLLFLYLGYFIFQKIRSKCKNSLLLLVLGCNFVLFLMLIFIASLVQSSDFPDYRLTSPIFYSFLLILSCVTYASILKRNKIVILLSIGVVISIAGFNSYRYYSYINLSLEQGIQGNSDKESVNSHLISSLKNASWVDQYFERKQVFTNIPEELYYHGYEGVLRIHKGFRDKLSDNFIKKTRYKVIVWSGDEDALNNFITNSVDSYFIKSKQKYDDGVVLLLELK